MRIEKRFDPAVLFRNIAISPEHLETPEEDLTGWRQEVRTKVGFSHHSVTQQLIEAAERGSMVSIYYHGGRECGRFRKFSPESVFRTPNSLVTYVTGFCHLRKAHRVFRTDRISLA